MHGVELTKLPVSLSTLFPNPKVESLAPTDRLKKGYEVQPSQSLDAFQVNFSCNLHKCGEYEGLCEKAPVPKWSMRQSGLGRGRKLLSRLE